MTLESILLLRTIILVLPYIFVLGFYFYKNDPFFLKRRTYIQLNLMMICVVITFLEAIIWHLSLNGFGFFNFYLPIDHQLDFEKGSSSSPTLVLLGIFTAVFGWLFTTKNQVINSIRNHSIQTLTASRLSTAYTDRSAINNITYSIFKECGEKDIQCDQLDQIDFFTDEDLKKYIRSGNLSNKQSEVQVARREALIYTLNYLEFIAVGIRFGDLDEEMMKKMLKSILIANYKFLKPFILSVQKETPSVFEHLTALYERWDCTKK